MTWRKRTIMEMARDCGINFHQAGWPELERFAELVRADERNRTWTQEHWTEYENSIAAAEREACANIAHQWSKREDDVGGYIEADIRARGQA